MRLIMTVITSYPSLIFHITNDLCRVFNSVKNVIKRELKPVCICVTDSIVITTQSECHKVLTPKVLPSADDHDQSSFFPYIIFKCPLHFQINGTVKSVHSSSPGEGICKIAKEVNADLIITGTRGMGSVRRTLLGSVSDYILHHAHVPVIVCRH